MEHKLRVSLDCLLEGVTLIDRNWRYLYVNKTAAEQGRREPETLIGRSMTDCYPGIEHTELFQSLRRVMETQRAESLRHLFTYPTGERRWFDFRIDPVPEGIFVLSLDATDQKEAHDTHTQLAAIVTSSDDAIMSTALDGTVLTWNASAERLYGYTAHEIIGKGCAVFVPEDKRHELISILEQVAGGERVPPYETQCLHKRGVRVDISLTVSPLRDKDRRVTGLSAIARDITDRKHAEMEVQRLNDEINLQRLRVFRATMTTVHDIVNNFLNNLQLVRFEAEGRLPDEMLTLFDGMIAEAATKLKTLGDLETVREKQMEVGVGIEH
jgi:PAS domain S-box-containing protein